MVLLILILLQIAAGAFVAGLDAGMGYNTWPLMDGAIIPNGLGVMQPFWRNLFEIFIPHSEHPTYLEGMRAGSFVVAAQVPEAQAAAGAAV